MQAKSSFHYIMKNSAMVEEDGVGILASSGKWSPSDALLCRTGSLVFLW